MEVPIRERDDAEEVHTKAMSVRDFGFFIIGTAFGVVLLGEILDALDKKAAQEQAERFTAWYRSMNDYEVRGTADETPEATRSGDGTG